MFKYTEEIMLPFSYSVGRFDILMKAQVISNSKAFSKIHQFFYQRRVQKRPQMRPQMTPRIAKGGPRGGKRDPR